jgi:peroxiredoxin
MSSASCATYATTPRRHEANALRTAHRRTETEEITMAQGPIAAQVSDLRASIATLPASDPMNAFTKEQTELGRMGAPDGVLAVGSTLPDARLLDQHGRETTLYAALGERPAVVVLYRGAWCPYCNIALKAYELELLPALAHQGVSLIAVSPQTPDGSLSMQEKNELTYGVLSDPGNAVARSLGVLTAPLDAAQAAQLRLGLDLTVVNADGTSTIPMPTVAIVDDDRVLRWIDVQRNYTIRTEPGEILDALDALTLTNMSDG